MVAIPVPSLSRSRWAGSLASAAGHTLRLARGRWRSLPSLAGAVAVSVGAGGFAGHVFGHGLTPWVTAVVGGAFALWIGTELHGRPS